MDAGADGAAQELARALELGPNDPWAISGVANEYRRVAGRYAEAAALMRRAVSLDPRNHDIRLQAAFAFEANDDQPGALAEVHEVLRLQPEMAFAYHAAGEMQWGVLGRMDDALRFMRRARALEPEAAHDALVTGYALLGEDAQAQRELASIRPLLDADEFLILRARIDVLAGRDTAARELLERALTVDPPSERLLVNAAKLGLTVAPEAARHALDRLRVVDPDFIVHASPYQQDAVVCTLAWSGDHDGAASVLMRSEKRIRGQPLYTLATDDRRAWLARALACAGRGEEAIVELEQVVAAKYHAGGSRGLAADHAFDAIRDDPRFRELIAQLRSVEDAERQRYLARPDLEDADVEALARTTSR
jgi:tetratricopeptide (TPR) repeat protein